jgi:hypothetical protein
MFFSTQICKTVSNIFTNQQQNTAKEMLSGWDEGIEDI